MNKETKEVLGLVRVINHKLEELDTLLNEFNSYVKMSKKEGVKINNAKVLKEGLAEFYGSIPLIAERTSELRKGGYKQNYVRNVLSGRRKNDAILVIAAKVLIQLRAKKANGGTEIKNLLNQIQSS